MCISLSGAQCLFPSLLTILQTTVCVKYHVPSFSCVLTTWYFLCQGRCVELMPLFLLLPPFTRRLDSVLRGGTIRRFVCLFEASAMPPSGVQWNGFRKRTLSGNRKSILRKWRWRPLKGMVLVSEEFITLGLCRAVRL